MIGIPPHSPLNNPLNAAPPEELRQRPEAGVPDRESIRMGVREEDAYRTLDVFFDVAEANGIKDLNPSHGRPYLDNNLNPPGNVVPLSVHFRPDRPDDTYSPGHLKAVNNFGTQLDARLTQLNIRNVGPEE